MKRGSDLYPHKPSPGHTLDEVLKSLRDLIRNDLPAGLVETPSPAADAEPAPAESGIDAPPPPAPDPSSSELVSEVLAGLERELTELDDLERPGARPTELESIPEPETPTENLDERSAAPSPDDDGSFTEEDVRRAIEDHVDDELAAAEIQEQDAAESQQEDDFPDDDFAGDDLPGDVISVETGTSAIAVEAETFTDDEATSVDTLEPAADSEMATDMGTRPITEPEPDIEPAPEPVFQAEPEAESIPFEAFAPSTEAMDTPPPQPRMPAAEPPARLRDSLALIAPDEPGAPIPESEAIPLLDDAIESGLPPDFAVRVRAIAIQAAARLEHEMRRAGRTPIATDLVPALARILEEALAQEFAQRQNDGFGEPEEGKAK